MFNVGPKVLIVDDEVVVCDLLSDELRESGYLCEVAFEGKGALQKLAGNNFDVALLDIKLPGMSGIDLLREIAPKYKLAIIMVTAVNDVSTAVESMKLGAADYIVKPFDLDLVSSAILAALEKRERPARKIGGNGLVSLEDDKQEFSEINAIASGIEMALDEVDKRSNLVTIKTINTARELGISEERIRQWVTRRVINRGKKRSVLAKFNHSAMAQIEMGMTEEYLLEDKPREHEN